jgi:hypothetical protein
MRLQDNGTGFVLWASANDTRDWASRPGEAWPCSTLAGRRFVACFDENGLLDLSVDGRDAPDDIDGWELSAIVADLAGEKLTRENAAWFVAVGQFADGEVQA